MHGSRGHCERDAVDGPMLQWIRFSLARTRSGHVHSTECAIVKIMKVDLLGYITTSCPTSTIKLMILVTSPHVSNQKHSRDHWRVRCRSHPCCVATSCLTSPSYFESGNCLRQLSPHIVGFLAVVKKKYSTCDSFVSPKRFRYCSLYTGLVRSISSSERPWNILLTPGFVLPSL